MKQRIFCVLLSICLLCAPGLAAPVAAEDAAEDGEAGMVLGAVPGVQGMQVNAAAAVVIEAGTGRVLFAQDADERLPMASTTKIMTALIALEQYDIDAVFEVDADAIRVEGSSMGLVEGDRASLRALATGMLLASGNDAANAAAVRVSGSIDAFVDRMNERAAEIGMENTHFETPSGLDGETHYSTAYDMAILAREALRNPTFAEICGQYRTTAEYGNPPYTRWLTNHNKLLNYYEGAFGVKTGFTRKSGRCLVSAAQQDGVELICVTLNCPDDWNVHQSLYDRFFDELTLEDLAQGIPDLDVPVTGGVVMSVAADRYDSAQIAVPVRGADVVYEIRVEPFLYAPVTRGQAVGNVRILLDGQEVAYLELIAAEDVPLLHEYEEKTGPIDWFLGLFGGG